MENLYELNFEELQSVEGGIQAPFAYRVGEAIRFLGHASLLGTSSAFDMVYGWQ